MKQVIFVLGMHRSGTSLVTRLFNLMGAAIPANILPPNADNPSGYWEPKALVDLNNRLLNEAQRPWHDDRPIPAATLAAPTVFPELCRFLAASLDGKNLVVLKDPRLCRLFPLWRTAASEIGVEPVAVLVIRDPACVADSLKRRAGNEVFQQAAITDSARADLLWSRYVLEAEYHSRGLPRMAFDYEAALSDPIQTLDTAIRALNIRVSRAALEAARASISAYVDASLPRSRGAAYAKSELPIASAVYSAFKSYHYDLGHSALKGALDEVRTSLDSVSDRFGAINQRPKDAPSASPIARHIVRRTRGKLLAGRPACFKRVVFLSHEPKSKGHIYRVANRVASLRKAGLQADWVAVDDAGAARVIRDADVVIAFRCEATGTLLRLREDCARRKIPWGVDYDDLVFVPDLMTPNVIHFLADRSAETRNNWRASAERHENAVRLAEFAWASTYPLAKALADYGIPVSVVPNGISPDRIAVAESTRARRSDGVIRIGYASGNPTHQADFEQVVPALAELLGSDASLRFVALGALKTDVFEALRPVRSQVEHEPVVPFEQLPRALAMFDINIAPLVHGNVFCEAKSELKFFEAAIVGVPTVATATQPFSEAIVHGETGLVVEHRHQWKELLGRLTVDASERRRLGENARHAALANFGPASQTEDLLVALNSVPGATPRRRGFSHVSELLSHVTHGNEAPSKSSRFRRF